MYVHGPMMESCVGSLGWVTKPRASPQRKGTTKGRDVVSDRSLSPSLQYGPPLKAFTTMLQDI